MKNWMVYATGVGFFLIIGILFIFLITRDNKPQNQSPQTNASQQNKGDKLDRAQRNGSSVIYTVHGQVVGEERYRGIRITVTPSERKAELLQGYNDQVIKTQSTPNTQAAYNAFVAALQGSDFDKFRETPKDTSEDTECPLGQHYSYDIISTSRDDAQHLWSTSCSTKDGDFDGRSDMVRTLFRKQVPDYEKFTAKFAL